MLNALVNGNFEYSDVQSMLEGHLRFLDKNTGLTNNARLDHYVFNPQGIMSNNRHFIAEAQMEAQPNGDATTEAQSIQILGYAYAYLGTGEERYRQHAKSAFNAYLNYFYNAMGDNPVPSTPMRYICNWLVNGKEPVLANWPLATDDYPTHGGFQGEILNWTNGTTQIPHGAPLWGEYLDKFTFAFDGALGWKSIVATVYGLKDDGVTTDWNKKGTQYDCDWVIAYTGQKISGDGFKGIDIDGNYREGSGWIISEGHPDSDKGKVALSNRNVNGPHKANWCNRQPVEHGGFLMERNTPWHNRPMNVPVRGVLNYGNAADAEEWFADAAYLMWKICAEDDPDKDKYYLVYRCVIETCQEYALIDRTDYFFRKQVGAGGPFSDGISYDYTYPDGVDVTYTRDSQGYIDCQLDKAAQHSMEQQSVWFDIDNNSRVLTTIAGQDRVGKPLNVSVKIKVAPSRQTPEANWATWQAKLPYTPGFTPIAIETKMQDFYQLVDSNGKDFIMADARVVVDYGTAQTLMQYSSNIIDGRSSIVAHTNFPTDDGGTIIGFWLTEAEKIKPTSIVIKSNTGMEIGVKDDAGWAWHWLVSSTGEQWREVPLDWSQIKLNSWQQNEQKPDDWPPGVPWTPPTRPTSFVGTGEVSQMSITKNSASLTAYCEWYCVNTIPQTYRSGKQVLMMYTVTIAGDDEFGFKLGDCRVLGNLQGGLFCTPGVIPFSNIYSSESTTQFDGWHGMPYPGYQHPFIWVYNDQNDPQGIQLTNMIEFLYQSQVWFNQQFGTLGPGASAYIWDRWDNYKYGTPNTWTMYHWGDGHAWAGYQPRAYFSAARAWYELVVAGRPVPTKLKTYVENWTKCLYKLMSENGGVSPTDFTTDGRIVCDPTDFTGHMCGLWLAGACISYLAGSKVEHSDRLIEMLVNELAKEYVVTGVPNHVMDGSWSPAPRVNTGSGPENNGMFFGFWSGEILRGLGLYLMYKEMNPGDNMYERKRD
ncbi:tail protein [Salmonella phage SeKF_80]